MNFAVSFSLHFAENTKYVIWEFSKRAILYLQIYRILYHFSSIFLFLNDVFTFIQICSISLVLKTRWVMLLKKNALKFTFKFGIKSHYYENKIKYKFYNPFSLGIFDLIKMLFSVWKLPTIHQ